MTELDLRLIKRAFEYFDGSDWNMIKELEDQAESEQAKIILHDRKVDLYRKEEQFAEL